MRHISILIPQGRCSLVNIEGSHQVLDKVNEVQSAQGKPPLFHIQFVGLSRQSSQRNGLFTIAPDVLIDEVERTDLIIIPSLHGSQREAAEMNKDFIPWIKKQYSQGAEVASLCIGAFFLAETGLLNGRACATHWELADQFRKAYPQADLMDDKIITEEEGIYTSGGAYSYLNLLVYLIEKYTDRALAIQIAKGFAIDFDRQSQSPFVIFRGQKTHNDEPIRQAQEFIEGNYAGRIRIDDLADRFNLGSRSFERRFKKATGNSFIEYVQRVKVEAAKRSFETSRKNINEVMFDVGYTDTKTFRSTFKKITGLTPVEYRNRYLKIEMAHVNG
jgi:transcriptional regulator GlxA family with amidase domain